MHRHLPSHGYTAKSVKYLAHKHTKNGKKKKRRTWGGFVLHNCNHHLVYVLMFPLSKTVHALISHQKCYIKVAAICYLWPISTGCNNKCRGFASQNHDMIVCRGLEISTTRVWPPWPRLRPCPSNQQPNTIITVMLCLTHIRDNYYCSAAERHREYTFRS